MKKILSVTLALVLLLSVIPTGIFTFTASAAWEFDDTSLVISGNGSISSYEFAYRDDITSVTITGAVAIYAKAFYCCENLESVTIGEDVYFLECGSFYDCPNITTINFNATNYQVDDGTCISPVFVHCDNLSTVIFGENAMVSGPLFNDCTKITSIVIPSSAKSLGNHTFSGCTGLKSIVIPSSVEKVFASTFEGCINLEDVWYTGSIEQKRNIDIWRDNGCLTSATWHYNSCPKSGMHNYENACDTECDNCGQTRSASEHIYSFECDEICDECGAAREMTNHVYDGTCDAICNTCGSIGEATSDHTYTLNNCCTCEICKYSKTPDIPVLEEKTQTTITLTKFPGFEYSIDGVNWQESNVFEGLVGGTTHTFYQRVAESEISFASEVSDGLTVTTNAKTAALNSPQMPIVIRETYNTVELLALEGYEYKCDDGEWTTNNVFTDLSSSTEYTFYQRIKETDTTLASATSEGTTAKTFSIVSSSTNNFLLLQAYIDIYGSVGSSGYMEMRLPNANYEVYMINCKDFIMLQYIDRATSGNFILENSVILAFFPNDSECIVEFISNTYRKNSYDEPFASYNDFGTLDRTTYTEETLILFEKIEPGSDFSNIAHSVVPYMLMLLNKDIYTNIGITVGGLGFLEFLGDTELFYCCDPASNHHLGNKVLKYNYDASCTYNGYTGDYCCSNCGEVITKGTAIASLGGHKFKNECDTDCDNCGHLRETKHEYSDDCDASCNLCGDIRTSGLHIYDNDSDMICNGCGYDRSVPDKITSNDHTVGENTISKITAGTTVEDFISNLNEGQYCKVFKGNEEVANDAAIGTGMKVKIMDGDTVKAEYTVIVTGDTNGDGDISVTDLIAIKSYILGKANLSNEYAIAADTSGDNDITITDFIQIKAKILGIGEIIAR